MRNSFKGIALALATTALVVTSGAATFAQDKTGTNVTVGAQGEQGPVGQLAMAQELYAFGIANKNALAMITAAQIADGVAAEDKERDVETSPTDGADASEEGEGVDAPVSAAAMLAAAKDLAGSDEILMAMIADVEAAGSRGRIGGASQTLSRLRAGNTDVFRVPFRGGYLAEVAINGDGDADLDVLVTDENGNTICKDVSYSDQFYCSWTPIWDGYFLIGVVNQGRIRNSYYLLTN